MFNFSNFFSFFACDMGIDLGTANTLVWVKNKGIAIREPSIIARHKKTKQIIAYGREGKKMLGKTPASIVTIRPLRGGTIADFDATQALLSNYIQQVHEMGNLYTRLLARPKVVIGIPSSVTEVERRAVWEAALSAGAREAYLIEEPMAAAIGEGISIFQSKGVMVVDIGGGTSEIAVISLGGIVVGRSLKLAGDDMDQSILHYIRLKHGILLGEQTVEDIKIKIGSAYQKKSKIKNPHKGTTFKEESQKSKIPEDNKLEVETERGEKMMIVRGRDIETGLPRSLRVSESEIREALSPILTQIIQAVADVLEETPPELLHDILEYGILLTGGGANLAGLDHLIVDRVHMPVLVSSDPMTSVVRGTGRVLEDAQLLHRVKIIGGLK